MKSDKLGIRTFLFFLLAMMAGIGKAPALHARQNAVCAEGTCFDTKQTHNGENFFLRGIAFFNHTFVKIYKVGFYTTRGIRSEEQVLSAGASKAVIVEYKQDINIRELFGEMKKGMPANPELNDQFVRIALAVYPIRQGERHEFIYEPGKGTLLLENGKPKLRIWGDPFARAFFGFWLERHNQGNELLRPAGMP